MTFNSINEKIGKYRWTICALIFFATTINYLDRSVLGLLRPWLADAGVFGTVKADQELYYSVVVNCFLVAYAIGMTLAGRFIDWIGTKRGYAFALLGWSIAAIGHAFAHTTAAFGFWRAALGISEAGNFPAANKTIAEWFPKKERAYATGFYNSGANIGAILTPLAVPWIAVHWGWEWAFVLTGVLGLIWLFFWYRTYASPDEKLKAGKLSKAEYDFIHSDKDEKDNSVPADQKEKIPWLSLLRFRQTWAFVFGKFLTDPIWWFYLFWLPAFLDGKNVRITEAFMHNNPNYTGSSANIPGVITWPLAVAIVYSIATLGSIFGGWLPKKLINGGMLAYKARKLSMFIYALFPLSVLFASRVGQIDTWYAVFIIAIACAAHQAWSANIFTTVTDMFPKKTVASVTGIGGMAGAFGGILVAWAAGLLLQHFTRLNKVEIGYGVMFVICALAYVLAWIIMHFFVPKLKRVHI
jgi:ACS family hexuronate transporter-like MFS transporter